MSTKVIIPFLLFVFTLLWMKPWSRRIEWSGLVYLLLIDAFSFGIGFNLNYYKIFSLFYVWKLKVSKREIAVSGLLLLFTFISGLLFVSIHPELKDPLSQSFLNEPIVRIFRNQFTLITSFIVAFAFIQKLKEDAPLDDLLQPFLYAGILVSLGIFIEVLFKVDLYSFFTGANPIRYGVDYNRAKGFCYEPRGAAQVISGCILSCYFFKRKKYVIWLCLPFQVALFFTLSFSGFIMTFLLSSIVLLRAIFLKDVSVVKKSSFSLVIFLILFFGFWKNNRLQSNIQQRSYVYENVKADKVEASTDEFPRNIINKFEVFDAAYLNFLLHEPKFLFWGTGSGMAGFASQNYIMPKDKPNYPKGATAAPLMGGVYLVSQFGIIMSGIILVIATKGLVFTKDNKRFFYFLLVLLFLLQYYYYFIFLIAIFIYQANQINPKYSLKET